jgi:N-acetylmuramoyl-L-alanine amidase
MPSAPPAKGIFVPWETAQSTSLERSRLLAVETVAQLTSHKITAYNGTAPVPPLNNIAAPAIAIEVGPQKLSDPADSLMQQNYQQSVAVAAATAIANARTKMEAMK